MMGGQGSDGWLCVALRSLPLEGHALSCAGAPLAAAVSAWAALLFGAICVVWAVRCRPGAKALAGVTLSFVSALLLALAAGMPVAVPNAERTPSGMHVILVDQSHSVRRDGDPGVTAALVDLADHFEQAPHVEGWRAVMLGAGDGVSDLSAALSLEALPGALRGAALGDPGRQSDLSTGLGAALDEIADAQGAGAVWIVSDLWATDRPLDDALIRAAGMGVPVHVLPIGSRSAEAGLVAWDVGPEQVVGVEAPARLNVIGAGALSWRVNAGELNSLTIEPTGGAVQPIRLPLIFEERGLSFIDLAFEAESSAASAGSEQTLYTLVRGPARILAFGDADWASGLDPAVWQVTEGDPTAPGDLASYDAIAVNGLEPADFPPGFDARLLGAAQAGIGLMVFNGGLRGAPEEMQRIADWEQSAIGPILPTGSDPATYVAEPPRRDVLIVIDVSGSMEDAFLDTAKAAALRVIDSLRPVDTLTILPFSTDTLPPFTISSGQPAELERARRFIGRLQSSGATEMGRAIAAAAALRGNNCAFFIIGDGGYDARQIRANPICTTTTIGVAGAYLPGFDTSWGDQYALWPGQSLGDITYSIFEPEERETFWRNGPLPPRGAEDGEVFDLPSGLGGLALSYPRVESVMRTIAASPPPHPVLVTRADPLQAQVNTAVFLGAPPPGWGRDPAWTEPLTEVFSQLVGWDDPDRYDLRLERSGQRFELRVTALGEGAPPVAVETRIALPDGDSAGFRMQSAGEPGAFVGSATVPLDAAPVRAALMIGDGAESQVIPIVLPARSEEASAAQVLRSEEQSQGINEAAVAQASELTGGVDLRLTRPGAPPQMMRQPDLPLWPPLLALAACLFAGSLFLGGARR